MSGSPWFPHAHRMPSHRANPMALNNHAKKLVMHCSEGDAHQSAASLAGYVLHEAKEYSAVINAYSGAIVQIYPINTGARSLLNGGIHGGVGCNRSGQIAFQVCIVGKTADGHHLIQEALRHKKVRDFFRWMHKDWGIPAHDLTKHGRSLSEWDKSGITCHANAPGNDHTDHVPIAPIIAAMGGSPGAGHHGEDRADHHGKHDSEHPGGHGSHEHAHQHSETHDGHGDHKQSQGGDEQHHHEGRHSTAHHAHDAHYLVLIAHKGKTIPLLNRDGAEAGWTIHPSEAKQFPHGHIRYEHVDEAIRWANEHGLIVAKVLRAKPAHVHPDHRNKHGGRLTKNPSTRWPTDKRTVERLKKVAEDLGVELRIVSGLRPTGRAGDLARGHKGTQFYLWEGWERRLPGFNLAAVPRHSEHEFGHAADVDVVKPDGSMVSLGAYPGGYAAARRHGLHFTASGESWHIAPEGPDRWHP